MFAYENNETTIAGNQPIYKENLPNDYNTVNELGDCFISLGQYDNAYTCYDKAAILDPDKANPYIGLGNIALQQEKLDDALTSFKVAIRLDGDMSRAYCGIAIVFQEYKEYQKAFENYLKCLEIDSDNMTALLGLFQTSCLMGSFSKVIEYLELYLQMHPEDCSVGFCLATLYMKEGKLGLSRKKLKNLTEKEPGNTDYINLLEEVEYLIEQKKATQQNV